MIVACEYLFKKKKQKHNNNDKKKINEQAKKKSNVEVFGLCKPINHSSKLAF